MVSLEEFRSLLRREIRRIPEMYLADIHAILVDPELCRSPGDPEQFLVMGHYHRDFHGQGPTIVLYYGSFIQVHPNLRRRAMSREIARTLAHELLHHWELRSGIDLLGDEDRRQIARWRRRLGLSAGGPTARDVLEALLFLYFLLLAIAFLAEFVR